MSDPASTLSPPSLEQRMLSFERGIRLLGVTILLLSAAPNIALAFSIKTYAALIPTHLLTPLSQLVFSQPYYGITLAILLPVAGTFIAVRARDPFLAMVASCVYLTLVMVQFAVTWHAFTAPIGKLLSISLR